jgi:hypothetical protein
MSRLTPTSHEARVKLSRRAFLARSATLALAAKVVRELSAADRSPVEGAIPQKIVIAGTPAERGRAYGERFRPAIRAFLEREVYASFVGKPNLKDDLLRYAAACARPIKACCPEIFEELEGMAAGSGLDLTEHILLTLHEELYHRGALPAIEHCTAVAIGPPATRDGTTLVGQTWDWMPSVFGLSSIVEWQRKSGPSVLAYGYPGLPVGAGLNAAGLALCWTSADLGVHKQTVRVGVPAYVLLAHLLYQDSLDGVVREAKQNRQAGWFTFVMADADGKLLNVEGSPGKIVVEEARRRLVRVGFGSRGQTATAESEAVVLHPRCHKMYDHLKAGDGQLDRERLQRYFADADYGICVGKATIDMMVFDTTNKRAFLSRGPEYRVEWKEFAFA